MNLRRLNANGVASFEEYLGSLKSEPHLAPPLDLLEDPSSSEAVVLREVHPPTLVTRQDAGIWLLDLLESCSTSEVERDKGLWAWLSLLLFDVVCPPDADGMREPGATARYIPDALNPKRYYRHLLAGPWRIVRAYRDNPSLALALLCQPLVRPGDIVEQLASRQELVTNRALVATATRLYVEPTTGQPRRGSGGKDKGAPRRLAAFCNQIDVTWDLYSMDSDELISILPKEFDRFRRQVIAENRARQNPGQETRMVDLAAESRVEELN